MNKNAFKITALVATVAAASGGIGYWAAANRDMPAHTAQTDAAGEKKPLYWYDPMVPNQHFDKPGKSPFMDMELVPKYADEGDDGSSVKIDPSLVQNLGIRTAQVERATLSTSLDVAASIVLNNRQVAVVQARAGGYVERVYARAPGDLIGRGAPLADILVPDWTAAQHELLAMTKSGDASLVQAVRERLRLLGMPPDLIARVEKTGQAHPVVTVSAPIGGLIQTLDVRMGMTVSPGMTLAQINGLDTVWVEAAVPEAQAAKAAVGRSVATTLAAYPGEVFSGKVVAVLPETNIESRTLRVRIELPNRDGRLRPGMFAQARLDGGAAEPVLLIPSDAVIRTGKRNIVLVAMDGGRYWPVEVKLGQEGDGKVAILAGLEDGQKVVVSGQFLIDSEASLRGVVARLNGGKEEDSGAAKAGAAPKTHEGVGKVESIDGNELTLSHGPITSLGWDAMTMSFALAKPDMAKSVKVGDRIRFVIHEGEQGYVIDEIRMEAKQ